MRRYLLDSSSVIRLFEKRKAEAIPFITLSSILPLTWYEIGNAARSEAYVLKKTTPEKAELALADLSKLLTDVNVISFNPKNNVDVFHMAGLHGLSFYDASYLHAASRNGLVLVTEDSGLRRAAVEAGIPVESAASL